MSELPKVRDLMDRDFVTLRPRMEIGEAINLLMDKRITGAAVVGEDGEAIGLLSEGDCVNTLLRGAYDCQPSGVVADFMSKDFETITPEATIFELAEAFSRVSRRRLLVEEEGRLIGQITRRDLLRSIQKHMQGSAGWTDLSES